MIPGLCVQQYPDGQYSIRDGGRGPRSPWSRVWVFSAAIESLLVGGDISFDHSHV